MRLTVLYDAACPFCVRCRMWMEARPAAVPLAFLDCRSPAVRARYAPLAPWLGVELAVAADDGRAWVGPAAFLMCLWALRRWRWLAGVLAAPALLPLAARVFRFVSDNRARLGRWLLGAACAGEGCRHAPATHPSPYR